MWSHATWNKWPSDTEDMALKKKKNVFSNLFGISDLTKVLIMMDEFYETIFCFLLFSSALICWFAAKCFMDKEASISVGVSR